MIGAILTTLFFALSAVTGQRVAVTLGSIWGNAVRLFIAAVVLGAIVLLAWPDSVGGRPFLWVLLSGVVGFGIGDVALFLAYERIGSRLTILLKLCLAPLFAMGLEWIWLGNGISLKVAVCAAIILAGVTMALRPGTKSRQKMMRRGSFGFGVLCAILAGFGQGTGAVISRTAEEAAVEVGMVINGISAAFQRVLAGFLFAAVVVVLMRVFSKNQGWKQWGNPLDPKLAPWLLGAALFGPVIGVSCFQWALSSLQSGIVLAVVATTPIVMIPLAAWNEHDHPSRLAIMGALVAVAGVVLLNVWA